MRFEVWLPASELGRAAAISCWPDSRRFRRNKLFAHTFDLPHLGTAPQLHGLRCRTHRAGRSDQQRALFTTDEKLRKGHRARVV